MILDMSTPGRPVGVISLCRPVLKGVTDEEVFSIFFVTSKEPNKLGLSSALA
jgi:hypothetical protein